MAETVFPNELILEKVENCLYRGTLINRNGVKELEVESHSELTVLFAADNHFGCNSYHTTRIGF